MIEKNGLKVYSQEEVLEQLIGPSDSKERKAYEYELQMEVLGNLIQTARKNLGLTQEELGKKIGVQKAQISKLEKSAKNVTIDTLVRVFNALDTKVRIKVEMPDHLKLSA
jgi:HTH-type transcriptional regulator/antitoxin HipB